MAHGLLDAAAILQRVAVRSPYPGLGPLAAHTYLEAVELLAAFLREQGVPSGTESIAPHRAWCSMAVCGNRVKAREHGRPRTD